MKHSTIPVAIRLLFLAALALIPMLSGYGCSASSSSGGGAATAQANGTPGAEQAVGERLFLDSGTLTPLLKRLEAAQLIKRTRSKEDERQVLIALTAQGQALKEKARAVPMSILEASACSVGELVAMKDEIVALRDRLNAVVGE